MVNQRGELCCVAPLPCSALGDDLWGASLEGLPTLLSFKLLLEASLEGLYPCGEAGLGALALSESLLEHALALQGTLE